MSARTSQTHVQGRESTTAARGRVQTALANLEQGHRDAMEELRVELCAYVGHLREDGLTREEALDNVRSLIAAPATPDGALTLTPVVRDALAELTLQWCEEEYARLCSVQES